MNHEMRLHAEPFEKIQTGLKTVKFRLFDEKRKKLKIGDTILFSKRSNESEKIKVRITAIKKFARFKDMAKIYPDAKGTEIYYSTKEERACGVVAIEFKLGPSDWGKGTENLSAEIDKVLYS